MSQIIAMAKRLQEAEETIANFKKGGGVSIKQSNGNISDTTSRSSRTSTPRPVEGERNDDLEDGADVTRATCEKQSNGDPSLSDLSLDEHGKVSSPRRLP